MSTIYTIGHSTRTMEEFVALLEAHSIEVLFDIRAFPASRRLPHFNREAMEGELKKRKIDYVWMKDLGGRRGKQSVESPNYGLRNQAFRNYADYMLTPIFRNAAEQVVERAARERSAIMCAEAVFFRCHRMLVSDYLTLHGHKVLHIQSSTEPAPHRVTREAQMISGQVTYPGEPSLNLFAG